MRSSNIFLVDIFNNRRRKFFQIDVVFVESPIFLCEVKYDRFSING